MSSLSEKINLIIRDVAELPERTSPEHWPEALILTSDELEEILSKHFTDNFLCIKKAAELIWFDNGMINRFEPLDIKLDLLNKWLLKQDEHLLVMVESDLSALSEEDLITVCCGEESEQERLISPTVNDFLNRIFDEEYEAQEPAND